MYQNPQPALRAVHAGWPHVVELGNDHLLGVYRRGQASMSGDGLIYKLRSTDGGQTWIDEGLVWQENKPNWDYRGPFVTKMQNGTLVLNCVRFDHSDHDLPLYNIETGGYIPPENLLSLSLDDGRTWSSPRVIPLPSGLVGNCSSPVVELPDGQWMLPFETWKSYDDPAPVQQRAMALWSKDKGATWNDVTTIADGLRHGRYYWDGRFVSLEGDQLLVLFWTYDVDTEVYLPIHYARSEDGGRTWTEPTPTNIKGQTSQAVPLDEERILAVYSDRESDAPGVYAVLSEDGGRTWHLETRVRVWDATGRAETGVVDRQTNISEHISIAFGRPTALRLRNGDVGVAFWATLNCVAHCRWCRLKINQ